MTPPAAPSAPRPSLAELARQTPERLTEQLRRALPGDAEQQPAVSAFNSSI